MSKLKENANDAVKWEIGSTVKNREDQFQLLFVQTKKIVEGWRLSLFSYEWLDDEGNILQTDNMIEKEKNKRLAVIEKLSKGDILTYPVMGIGMNDNVEIGSGKAEFLTLTAEGYKILPVFIHNSCLDDFKEYLQ